MRSWQNLNAGLLSKVVAQLTRWARVERWLWSSLTRGPKSAGFQCWIASCFWWGRGDGRAVPWLLPAWQKKKEKKVFRIRSGNLFIYFGGLHPSLRAVRATSGDVRNNSIVCSNRRRKRWLNLSASSEVLRGRKVQVSCAFNFGKTTCKDARSGSQHVLRNGTKQPLWKCLIYFTLYISICLPNQNPSRGFQKLFQGAPHS